MRNQTTLLAALIAASFTAHAAVTTDEAKALGTTLTAIGADKAPTRTARFRPTPAA